MSYTPLGNKKKRKACSYWSLFWLLGVLWTLWTLSFPTSMSRNEPNPGLVRSGLLFSRREEQVVSLACNDPAVTYLKVVKEETSFLNKKSSPKILCLVLTQTSNHRTRLQAILDTWGKKCEFFVAASDQSDLGRKAIGMDSIEGYWGIWDKFMKTLSHIVLDSETNDQNSTAQGALQHVLGQENAQAPLEVDWILKADDDTFMIMENLKSFLANKTNMTNRQKPVLYGRIIPWPTLRYLEENGLLRAHLENRRLGKHLMERYGPNHTLRFAHGGPGYVMNWKYAKILARSYVSSQRVVKGTFSEDISNAVTMLGRDILPLSTWDEVTGLERSHPETPQNMFENPRWISITNHNIEHLGKGKDCCSPTSISFHHVSAHQMRLLDYQLYTCPTLGYN